MNLILSIVVDVDGNKWINNGEFNETGESIDDFKNL